MERGDGEGGRQDGEGERGRGEGRCTDRQTEEKKQSRKKEFYIIYTGIEIGRGEGRDGHICRRVHL